MSGSLTSPHQLLKRAVSRVSDAHRAIDRHAEAAAARVERAQAELEQALSDDRSAQADS